MALKLPKFFAKLGFHSCVPICLCSTENNTNEIQMMKSAAILFFMFVAPSVFAATTSNNLSNTARVVSSCSINTTDNMNFGLFDPLNDDQKSAQGRVEVACTKGSYGVRVGYGASSKLYRYTYEYGSFYTYRCTPRSMISGAGKALGYTLYKDAAMITPISTTEQRSIGGVDSSGQACGMSSDLKTLTFTSQGAQSIDLYGKILGDKSVQAGSYMDTLAIEVTF